MIFVLMLVFGFQEIKVAECCAKSDQHGDDCNKSTCSVSDILFKHGLYCFTTNLYVSAE